MKFWEQPCAQYFPKKEKAREKNKGSSGLYPFNEREAAHAVLYCKNKESMQNKYAIMMQLRFDGTVGFPGGYIDGEDIKDGLNRELHEEIGLESQYHFEENNYFGTWFHKANGLIDHFYVKKYSENDFKKIEETILNCEDWGGETLAILRVPLSTPHSTANFFKNNFVGNAREQLIRVLLKENILTENELKEIWEQINV